MTTGTRSRPFIPAKPSSWIIGLAQLFVRLQLYTSNRLRIGENDVVHLKNIPDGTGMILACNHADEMDPRICIELSRLSSKRFIAMCNREAFDEAKGIAGWVLQRLGLFSVERGMHDDQAKTFAVEVVESGRDVLLIFPEGEIFYLNETVQQFHSGAVEIAMQSIINSRKRDPNWTACIVPMAIKYHHAESIEAPLENRVEKLEKFLELSHANVSIPKRLVAIQKALLERKEVSHSIPINESPAQSLTEEISKAQLAILSQVESKHPSMVAPKVDAIDESWHIGAELREKLATTSDPLEKVRLQKELKSLGEVAHLSSWKPGYYRDTHSQDRLAEAVLKLEREAYGIKRPKQLAARDVFVKIAAPIDLGSFVDGYSKDPHSIRHTITQQLQTEIQTLIDQLIEPPKS